MWCRFLSWLLPPIALSVILGPIAWAQEVRSDQVIEGDRLIDFGYQFEIQAAGPDWQLLPEEQIRMIVPEAIGGAMVGANYLYLAIIVEQASRLDIGSAANLLIEAMPLESRVVEGYEAITFQGLPAIRYLVSGVISGLRVRYGTVLVQRMGHLYQVTCFGLMDVTAVDGSSFAPLWDSFHFRETSQVTGRTGRPAAPETTGVGFRVQQGIYESAANGLSVVPTLPGWRVSIGMELERGNPDAEVGLAHESPDVYIAFTHERITGQDPLVYATDMQQSVQQSLGGILPRQSIAVAIDEIPLTLMVYRGSVPAFPQETAYGVFSHGEEAYQVMANWTPDQAEAVLALLPEAFGQVHLLSTDQRQALQQELARSRDSQNVVGADFTLRNGLYQDFRYNLTWRKPSPRWRIVTGQQAWDYNPIARIVMEEVSSGIFGMLIVENVGYLTPEQYHTMVLNVTLPPGHPSLALSPTIRPTGYGEIRASRADMEVTGLELSYLITTTVVADRGIQLLLWGYPGNMATSEDALWAAVDGLDVLHGVLLANEITPQEYRDRRLGYRIGRPSPTWNLQDQTPYEVQAVASMVMASENTHSGLLVLAMCTYAEGQDERWFEQMVHSQLLHYYTEEMGLILSEATQAHLSGHPSRYIEAATTDSSLRMVLHLLQRDHSYFAVLAFTEAGWGPPLDTLVGSFEFID